MRKAVWISMLAALVLVNVIAELMDYFAGIQVEMRYRLALALSLTVTAVIFAGSFMLVNKLGGERPMSGRFRPAEVLACLQSRKIRCTYGAMAGLLGIQPQEVGRILGRRRPLASWVVNQQTGLPMDYEESEKHPELLRNERIIDNAENLKQFIYECRG